MPDDVQVDLGQLYGTAMREPESPVEPEPLLTVSDPTQVYIHKAKWIEYYLEKLVDYCKNLAIFKILEYIAKLGIAASIFLYIWERPERTKDRLYQLLGSGGAERIRALEQLHGNGENLSGIKIEDAYLSGLRLPGGKLRRAFLAGSDLSNADLHGADLIQARLQNSDLRDGHLEGAKLTEAKFTQACLLGTIERQESNVRPSPPHVYSRA